MDKRYVYSGVLVLLVLIALYFTFGEDVLLQPDDSFVLGNELVELNFDLDVNGLFGLSSIRDVREDYIHSVTTSDLSWEVRFLNNLDFNYVSTKSSDSNLIKSYGISTLSDGSQELTLIWDGGIVGGDTFSVEQTFTLRSDESFAHMGIKVFGENLNSHSVNLLSPVFNYNSLPEGSYSFLPFMQQSLRVDNPQTFSKFSGSGLSTGQLTNGLFPIFPFGTKSIAYFARYDSEGHAVQYKFKNDGISKYSQYFGVSGDKQTLNGEDYSQPYDFVVGVVSGKTEQSSYDATMEYKKWLEVQSFYPKKLIDREEVPDYIKRLKFASFINSGAIPPRTGEEPGMTPQEIIDILLLPYNVFNLEESLVSSYVWNLHPDRVDQYLPSPNLVDAMLQLEPLGVKFLAWVGNTYFRYPDVSYDVNPALQNAHALKIDGTQIFNNFNDGSIASWEMAAHSPAWQEHQTNQWLEKLGPNGASGFILDAPLPREDFGNGVYGGGSHYVQGTIAEHNLMKETITPQYPDFTIGTEGEWEHYAGTIDIYGVISYNVVRDTFNGFGADVKDVYKTEVDTMLYGGRIRFFGDLAGPFWWGHLDPRTWTIPVANSVVLGYLPMMWYNTHSSAVLAEESGGICASLDSTTSCSPGFFCSENNCCRNGYVWSQESGEDGACILESELPIGLWLDESSWTNFSTPFFTQMKPFTENMYGSFEDYDKYTIFGEYLRPIETDSVLEAINIYDGVPSTQLSFPSVGVGIWRGLDDSVGIIIANGKGVSQVVGFDFSFEDYGLTAGTNYNLYEHSGNEVILIDQYSGDMHLDISLESHEFKTLILIDSSSDLDNDGEGNLRWDTGEVWDNCPDDYNPGQEDSNGNGVGNVCDVSAIVPPPVITPPGNGGGGGGGGSASYACNDNRDNDGDGYCDFDGAVAGVECSGLPDSGCVSNTDNNEGNDLSVGDGGDSGVPECSDLEDNDGDGFVDMADAGCTDPDDDSEINELIDIGEESGQNIAEKKEGVKTGKVILWIILVILIVIILIVIFLIFRVLRMKRGINEITGKNSNDKSKIAFNRREDNGFSDLSNFR
ncbi:MAG: hypothetical protein Q8P57_05550 [Candidatus Pacearchaeota archaeon]|nr:hypothetical protein [Candidatus Pacearchaeota archaeon]